VSAGRFRSGGHRPFIWAWLHFTHQNRFLVTYEVQSHSSDPSTSILKPAKDTMQPAHQQQWDAYGCVYLDARAACEVVVMQWCGLLVLCRRQRQASTLLYCFRLPRLHSLPKQNAPQPARMARSASPWWLAAAAPGSRTIQQLPSTAAPTTPATRRQPCADTPPTPTATNTTPTATNTAAAAAAAALPAKQPLPRPRARHLRDAGRRHRRRGAAGAGAARRGGEHSGWERVQGDALERRGRVRACGGCRRWCWGPLAAAIA